jgi:hypothetical protein
VEFYQDRGAGELTASPASPAYGRADLLTAVLHELGPVQGHNHEDEGLMDERLPLGTRRLPDGPFFDPDRDVSGDLEEWDDATAQLEWDPDAIDNVFASLE